MGSHGAKAPNSTMRVGVGAARAARAAGFEVGSKHPAELELELILSRWLWERGEKGGASLQKQARVRALCGVMQ